MTTLLIVLLSIISAISLVTLVRVPFPEWLVILIGASSIVVGVGSVIAAALAAPLDSSMSLSLVIAALAAATLAGGPVVRLLYFFARIDDGQSKLSTKKQNDLPWTAWIGAFERFGFTLALILSLPTVAAILLGIKALGQYTSTDNRAPAKRVLGTLVSIAWALTVYAVLAVGYPVLFGISEK